MRRQEVADGRRVSRCKHGDAMMSKQRALKKVFISRRALVWLELWFGAALYLDSKAELPACREHHEEPDPEAVIGE